MVWANIKKSILKVLLKLLYALLLVGKNVMLTCVRDKLESISQIINWILRCSAPIDAEITLNAINSSGLCPLKGYSAPNYL